MYLRTLASSTILALAFSGAGLAAEKTPSDLNKDGRVTKAEKRERQQDISASFKKADTNNDGGLSRQELKGIKEFEGIEKNFDKMDVNNDGKVTLTERNNWLKSTGKQQQKKKDATK